MRVKALINFTGIVTMTKGQELEIINKEIYKDLIDVGYVEEVKKKKVKANEN